MVVDFGPFWFAVRSALSHLACGLELLATMAPLYLFLAALYTGLTLAAQCQSIQPKSDPQTAPGVTFKVLANDLSKPRGVIADPKGNLLVVEAGAKGVRRIELDDGKGLDTCVTKSSSLVDDKTVSAGNLPAG